MDPDAVERNLAATLSADVVGYSRPAHPAVHERYMDGLRKAGLKE